MITYISVLRALNVGGQNKILMQDLKSIYEKIGFSEVRTYIQSGNVIFKSNSGKSDIEITHTIESEINKKFKSNITVFLRSRDDMINIIDSNPFVKQGINEMLHLTFLQEAPDISIVNNIRNINFGSDKFEISGKEVYLYCPGGYGISKLSNNFFENKLKVKATTRNWNTINKLALMADL